jgi:hypothetical protein
MLRKIFAPTTDEVTGDWWRLHSEELYDLLTWAGHVTRVGDKRNAYRVLVG